MVNEIIHICKKCAWEGAMERGTYAPESLNTDGFIHFSSKAQVLHTANSWFSGERDLVLLNVDSQKLVADLRWERSLYEPAIESLFPHLYGPLNLEAVIRAVDFLPDEDGNFKEIPSE